MKYENMAAIKKLNRHRAKHNENGNIASNENNENVWRITSRSRRACSTARYLIFSLRMPLCARAQRVIEK